MEKKLNSLPKHIRKQGEQTKVEKKKKSIPVHGKRNEMEQFHRGLLVCPPFFQHHFKIKIKDIVHEQLQKLIL
jgi:hypothetical protein